MTRHPAEKFATLTINVILLVVSAVALLAGTAAPPWYIGGSWWLILFLAIAGLVFDYVMYRKER